MHLCLSLINILPKFIFLVPVPTHLVKFVKQFIKCIVLRTHLTWCVSYTLQAALIWLFFFFRIYSSNSRKNVSEPCTALQTA